MPRRREKFVEITKTVTVTEIVNGAPDKHPSSCEVKVTNVSPAGPHPVNVSIKHLHEKWHSCEDLGDNLGKGTVIRIQETHKPYYKRPSRTNTVYEDVVTSKVETSERPRSKSQSHNMYFNKSSDNIIDLEFRHPILIERRTSSEASGGGRRKFADLRKRVSTTTKTSTTETEKVTYTRRRSSSAHTTSSKRSYSKPEVHTLYYRTFVDENVKGPDPDPDESSDSGSVIIHRNSTTRRSQSADPISPIAPPRKRLGREESLHYYRDDEEVLQDTRPHLKSPEPGNTSVSMNDTFEHRNLTAGITSITMNNSCTDTSFESRFSTIPRARSSPPARVNHIKINVIGPIRSDKNNPIGGMVGDEVTMDLNLVDVVDDVNGQEVIEGEAPPKPPRRSKWEMHHHHTHHHHIGEPLATSTPMTTIERKQTREEESTTSSRKSTRSARPPDINIIECEDIVKETRSPARTPATPIVVVNQTPSSRRSSQDLLGGSGERRRKSTVTDIDWYAAFNMKDPSSPTKPIKPPFGHVDERKTSSRRRASDSSMIGVAPADIDLNQIFACTSSENRKLKEKDEKCQCNACKLIRMSEAEREMRRATRTRQSRSYSRVADTRSSTLPSRHRTSPVNIELDDVFNPKPFTKPPTPPSRRRPTPSFVAPPPPSSSPVDESHRSGSSTIDRQVTSVTNRDSHTQSQLHARTQLLQNQNQNPNPSSAEAEAEDVDDWVGQMMHDANEWEKQRTPSRKTSNASTASRKVSVARRISVDDLKKPEKKKKTSVSLPPSDVSIDDIFTALTTKKKVEDVDIQEKEETQKSPKKTFIITSKLRAQDVDVIDFEKDREAPTAPIAPPRSKKPEVSTAAITMKLPPPPSEAEISLDDVFATTCSTSSTNLKSVEEDEKIRRRIAEFERSKQEKELQKTGSDGAVTTSRLAFDQSDISMDDVFNTSRPQDTRKGEEVTTSTATITLDNVFNTDGLKKPESADDVEDQEIQKRIGEFKRTEEEKQRLLEKKPQHHLAPMIFEESNISMDDVFSGNRRPSQVVIVESDDVIREEKHLEKRVEEFEKALEDREAHKIEDVKEQDHHDAPRIFDGSNISMDDVFSPSSRQTSPEKVTSTATISLDNVFNTENLKKSEPADDVENKEIQKRVAEFQRNEEEKQLQLSQQAPEHHLAPKIFEDSEISMDDVFSGNRRPSQVVIVESDDVIQEEKHLEKRVEEFERTKEIQEIRRIEELEESSHHTTMKLLEDSTISMDDVFSPNRTSSVEVTIHEKPKAIVSLDDAIASPTSTTINLDNVFNTENLKKPEPSDDVEEQEIQKRVAEFQRAEEEKQHHLEQKPEHQQKIKIFEDSNISMDDVFSGARRPSQVVIVESDDVIREEKHLEKRVEEFEKTKEIQEIQRIEELEETSHHTAEKIFEDSNISMDDVFSQPSRHTSFAEVTANQSVDIRLDNVFNTVNLKKPEPSDDVDEQEIQKRIGEFKRAEEEKQRHLKQQHPEHHLAPKIFEDSNISMDDVFSGNRRPSQVVIVESDDVIREEKHLEKRVEEFEKALEDREAHKIEDVKEQDHHDAPRIFDDSNISMDDVFGSPSSRTIEENEKTTKTTTTERTTETTTRKTLQDEPPVVTIRMRPPPPPEAEISLDDVFATTSSTSSTNLKSAEEDEKIRRRIAEFERSKQEKELQKTGSDGAVTTSRIAFDQSDISMDDVFNTSRPSASEDGRDAATSTATITLDNVFNTEGLKKPEPADDVEDQEIQKRIGEFKRAEEEKQRLLDQEPEHHQKTKIFEDSNISMDDVFSGNRRPSQVVIVESDDVINEEKHLEKRVEEFEKTKEIQEIRKIEELEESSHHTVKKIFEDSNISMDDVFSTPSRDTPSAEATSTATINLDNVFDTENLQKPVPSDEVEDKEIQKRIAEFKRAEKEKQRQLQQAPELHLAPKIFEDSDISMDDVFAGNRRPSQVVIVESDDVIQEEKHLEKRVEEFEKTKEIQEIRRIEELEETSHRTAEKIFEDSNISMDDVFSSSSHGTYPAEVTSTATISLDNVFNTENLKKPEPADEVEDKEIQKRVAEFQKNEEEKQRQLSQQAPEHHLAPKIFEDSDISMDDVFSGNRRPSQVVIVESDDVIQEEKHLEKRVEEFEKTMEDREVHKLEDEKEHQEARRRIFEDSAISMDDVFNVSTTSQTSETQKTTTTTTTTTESSSYSKRQYLQHQPSLDDMFGPQTPTVQVFGVDGSEDLEDSEDMSQQKLNKEMKNLSKPSGADRLSTLAVPGKWNDSMISTTSTISLDDSFNASFRKPLTLPVDSWIDSIVAKATEEATKEAPKTPKHHPSPTRISQEIKYEWVADLVGVPEDSEVTEASEDVHHQRQEDDSWVSSVVYRPTLETRAYTLRASVDMSKVFGEEGCVRKDEEDCGCTACQLTEQELEEMRRRQIEPKRKDELQEVAPKAHLNFSPSEISIDDVFNPEKPLHVSTEPPPISSSTRTYYISPKVSETVTTTHQWKDADISMDEIFSPVSTTSVENRRFSNFYEDRSGWDTVGSEDSGVMSGGGRRRSSRAAAEQVIDEAFKGIFEKEKRDSTQYDDFYITSLQQQNNADPEYLEDVDGENLDVTQFVDDILGKSMDEAAFLSSTKSLRSLDHTDTSIDRKKSAVHPYYRTRTDTSIDKKKVAQQEVISEEQEDHIMKLVFVEPTGTMGSKGSKGSLSRGSIRSMRSGENDEELLEIEIRPEYFLIRGSYSLLIPKSDPLGQMLETLRNRHESLATLDFSLTRKLKKLLLSCIKEKAEGGQMAASEYDGLLSSRGLSLVESIDHASSTFLRMNVDKYHPHTNPHGIVNFCTAENNICTPLLEERFKHLELFFPNTDHLARYPPSGGWPEARQVLVKYFKEFLGARVSTEELVLTASTRTGYDVVSHCLFEEGDVLLTNGPVYTGTISNVHERAGCTVECVETDLSNPRLEVKNYEIALERHQATSSVAGIIILNPHNPLGVVFPPEDVVTLCNWAASKNLHVIIDEVFANCVFDKTASKFRPFLSYRHRVHRPENVAWLWSVSKDFGLPGLKFAVIHSANEGLRQAALKLQLYHPCSPFVQDFAVKLLSDSEWLREFHGEVQRRMGIHYRYTAENLKRLEIPFVPAQAGIFVFADFSKHCQTPDFPGELEFFERLAATARVMLTPGEHQKCHKPGWFRIVFACSREELEEGFKRLYGFLGTHLTPVGRVDY